MTFSYLHLLPGDVRNIVADLLERSAWAARREASEERKRFDDMTNRLLRIRPDARVKLSRCGKVIYETRRRKGDEITERAEIHLYFALCVIDYVKAP